MYDIPSERFVIGSMPPPSKAASDENQVRNYELKITTEEHSVKAEADFWLDEVGTKQCTRLEAPCSMHV